MVVARLAAKSQRDAGVGAGGLQQLRRQFLFEKRVGIADVDEDFVDPRARRALPDNRAVIPRTDLLPALLGQQPPHAGLSLRDVVLSFGGVRAIGVDLGDRAQVSTNIHDPVAVPLGMVIEEVRALAATRGARPVAAEVVGLVPEAALRELPEDVPLRDFDPARQVLENRVERASS